MTQPPVSNYVQVGRTIECAACFPDKYDTHTNECNCICHESVSDWEEEAGKLLGEAMAHQGITRPLPNLEAFIEDCKKYQVFISKQLTSQRQQLVGKIEKIISIHQDIESMHDIYPKDWHDGNINALQEAINLINNSDNASLTK